MKISVRNLKNSATFFEFNADIKTLALDNPDIKITGVHVKSKIDKNQFNILVTSDAIAKIDLICESCLSTYSTELHDNFTILYTTSSTSYSDDEMTRLLSHNTTQVDLTEGLRESILLSLPMRYKCSTECKGLCDRCGINLNEVSCDCKKVEIDSRWEGLRGLLDDNSALN